MLNNSNNALASKPQDNTKILEKNVDKSSVNSTNHLELNKAVEKLSTQLKKELDSRSKLKAKN